METGEHDMTSAGRSEAVVMGIGELVDEANATVRQLMAECAPGDPMQTGLAAVGHAVQQLAVLAAHLDTERRGVSGRAAPLDLNKAVTQMSGAVQRILGPFITLETKLESGVWSAAGRGQVEQMLLGLVINAREALPLGGAVTVATHRWRLTTPREFRVGALGAGAWAVLEVRDNRPRIDERLVSSLTAAAATDQPVEASLSLGSCAALIRSAHGQVILDTSADGTAIAACFPAVPAPRPWRPATGAANAVLVVDEDEWVRLCAARALRHAGFGVLMAEHGDAARDLLGDVAGSCVRVVLCEAGAQCGGGVSLADSLRAERPELEVLLMGPAVGPDGGARLEKPLSAEALVRAVRARLGAET